MDPFLGEIRMFAGNYAPLGWMLCNGQILRIQDNDVLFSLIGTTYGGDGQTTFALPDLRGRIPIDRSSVYPMGAAGGTETVVLSPNQMPAHTHRAAVQSATADKNSPTGNVWGTSTPNQFANVAPSGAMAANTVGSAGLSQAHDNIMPYQTMNFIIAVEGLYPTQG